MREITAGSTDVTVYMRLRNAADGSDATGLDPTTIDLEYVRTRAVAVGDDATDLGSANAAHSDWGGFEVSAGLYRFDFPDAAFAAGVPEAVLTARHADILTESLAVAIVGFNPQDGMRLGLTALPNAAAGGNGGLPTVDASNFVAGVQGTINTLDGLDTAQDAQHATTQAAVADVPTNAEFAAGLAAADDATLAAIGDLPTNAELATALAAADDATLAAVAVVLAAVQALNNLSSGDVQSAVAAALAVTRAEPGQGTPGATIGPLLKLDYLYQWARNRRDSDASGVRHYADDGTTVAQKATQSDDGTTYTRGEMTTGP